MTRQVITRQVQPRPPGINISGVALAFEQAYALLPTEPDALVRAEVWTDVTGAQFVSVMGDVEEVDDQ